MPRSTGKATLELAKVVLLAIDHQFKVGNQHRVHTWSGHISVEHILPQVCEEIATLFSRSASLDKLRHQSSLLLSCCCPPSTTPVLFTPFAAALVFAASTCCKYILLQATPAAQTPPAHSDWFAPLPDGAGWSQESHSQWLHRLGNLCIVACA